MTSYDDRLFAPPAPVLSAHLRNPQSGTTIPDVLFLIDTGAVNAAGIRRQVWPLSAKESRRVA